VPEDSSAVDGEGERPVNTEHGEDGTPETVVEHADVWIVSVAEGLEPCRAHLWPGRPPGRGGTTRFAYDPGARRTTVTDPRNCTFAFDSDCACCAWRIT
jgi:YD repeat-containing protein